MRMLEDKIRAEGRAINADVLLVDSFLNHQVDVQLMKAIGEAFATHFEGKGITRVITVESSGIAPAAMTALAMGLPLVVLKKQTSRIMNGDVVQTTVQSFTKGTRYELTLKRAFVHPDDRILLIDDFLASGEAAMGVHTLLTGLHAQLAGIGIVVEKSFQPGRQRLEQLGCDVCSLARIKRMDAGTIEFLDEA